MNDEACHDYERELEARGFRWDEGRRENVLQGTLRRAKRRKTTQLVSFAAAASLVAAVGAATSYRWARHDVIASTLQESPQVLHTDDGSTITLEGLDSQAHLGDQSPQHVAVLLDRGRGRFQVTKNPQRTFEVEAGGVTVTVVGTEFVVERRQEHTWVQVTTGTVRVSWPGGEELLRAPAENLFPPPRNETVSQPTRTSDDPPGAGSRLESGATAPSAAALLLEADSARVAGRDEEAIRLLRRVMREHPTDPQARMAAFVLGRMLAAKGRNAEAMQAFAEARRSGKGELAEEALARQVEVASESGDHPTAHRLAAEFARSYPKSSRLDAVKRMGEAR
jgi:FecR protein/Tetratricopeptide repeat